VQALKKFLKRNAPVFIFGLIIALVFLLIILTQPNDEGRTPSGFKRVEEEVFEREPKEPKPAEKPTEYAPQIPSPGNKGKPYFYGEYDPNLRDEEGYPIPPSPETVTPTDTTYPELVAEDRFVAQETYTKRTAPVKIKFTKEGFSPSDALGYTGQKIEWVNETDKQIVIKQVSNIHEALKDGLVIEPGKSASFRPLINGLFVYIEAETVKYGTITVQDATTPLQ